MANVKRHSFKDRSGYIIGPQERGQELVAIGHTALLAPWRDSSIHKHTASEEYYFLRQGELNFVVADMALTLRPQEILMIKPHVPHAITGGRGLIEHFGLRAPALSDKQVLGDIPLKQFGPDAGERELRGESRMTPEEREEFDDKIWKPAVFYQFIQWLLELDQTNI